MKETISKYLGNSKDLKDENINWMRKVRIETVVEYIKKVYSNYGITKVDTLQTNGECLVIVYIENEILGMFEIVTKKTNWYINKITKEDSYKLIGAENYKNEVEFQECYLKDSIFNTIRECKVDVKNKIKMDGVSHNLIGCLDLESIANNLDICLNYAKINHKLIQDFKDSKIIDISEVYKNHYNNTKVYKKYIDLLKNYSFYNVSKDNIDSLKVNGDIKSEILSIWKSKFYLHDSFYVEDRRKYLI